MTEPSIVTQLAALSQIVDDFDRLTEENAALRAALERMGIAVPGIAT